MGEGAQALPAVRALADEGEPRAMVLLGSMLLGGSSYRNAIGQPLDPAEALQWLERAARAGDATAAVRLGGLHERGEHVPRQPSLAENWYLRAARQGDGAGLYSLGMLYARGADPVSQRPVPAWMLLTLAERASRALSRAMQETRGWRIRATGMSKRVPRAEDKRKRRRSWTAPFSSTISSVCT